MSSVERYDCDSEGEQFDTPDGSYVLFRDYERLEEQMRGVVRAGIAAEADILALRAGLVETYALMRELLEEMDRLAGYGDEETDGAVYLTVHEWQERVRALMEKDLPGVLTPENSLVECAPALEKSGPPK